MKQGMAKGKKEGKAEVEAEMAKKLLQEGVDIPFISRVTGLPLERIVSLSKKRLV